MGLEQMFEKSGGTGGLSSNSSPFSIRNTVITAVVVIVAYFVYTKLFKAKTLDIKYNEQVLSTSTDNMSNGTSFLQTARTLANEMYTPWLWGLFSGFTFKDSDEALIGSIMLKVQTHEYTRLNDVYVAYKSTNKMNSDSLESDLRHLFNAKELKQYMSHLIPV